MEKLSNRKAVQVKLSPPEQALFQQIKKWIGTDSNSTAIRMMMADEKLMHLASSAKGNERKRIVKLLKSSWKLQGRPVMLQSLLQLQGGSNDVLDKISTNFADLDSLVQGLLWNSSNIANNLNQIAHAVNLAAKQDPADVDTWQWTINALNALMQSTKKLHDTAREVHTFIKGNDAT